MPLFGTDGEGYVVWNGIKVKVGGNYLKSTMINAHVGWDSEFVSLSQSIV